MAAETSHAEEADQICSGIYDDTFSPQETVLITKRLAQKYLSSCPGLPEVAGNMGLYNTCKDLLDGKELTGNTLDELIFSLNYRVYLVMDRATAYKNMLELDFLDNEQWCYEMWLKDNTRSELRPRFYDILDKVENADLFIHPSVEKYLKGERYLSVAMATNNYNNEEVDFAIERMKLYKDQRSDWHLEATRILRLGRYSKLRQLLSDAWMRTRNFLQGRCLRGKLPPKDAPSPKYLWQATHRD